MTPTGDEALARLTLAGDLRDWLAEVEPWLITAAWRPASPRRSSPLLCGSDRRAAQFPRLRSRTVSRSGLGSCRQQRPHMEVHEAVTVMTGRSWPAAAMATTRAEPRWPAESRTFAIR